MCELADDFMMMHVFFALLLVVGMEYYVPIGIFSRTERIQWALI